MANKGDNYTRKSDTGDDYADYVKDKAKLLKALKANKWDDYASKPKFDTARFLTSCS